jgi:hypothetical protein
MKSLVRLAVAAIATLSFASLAAAANADVVIGATSVTTNTSVLGSPYSPLSALIDQSGLSANYVSGVTDFDSFTASTTATYSCCFPELAGVTPGQGDLGHITFNFAGPVTIDKIVIWNQAGSGSLNTFDLAGLTGLLTMPGNSQDFPQPAEVFSFAPTTLSSITLEIQSNYGSCCATILNEVAFGGSGGVPEPAAWALMIMGFGLAGAGLRRRTALA